MGRPSFDKIVITLSEYYHTLKKIQDVDTECPELSEESEEGADRPLVFPPLTWPGRRLTRRFGRHHG